MKKPAGLGRAKSDTVSTFQARFATFARSVSRPHFNHGLRSPHSASSGARSGRQGMQAVHAVVHLVGDDDGQEVVEQESVAQVRRWTRLDTPMFGTVLKTHEGGVPGRRVGVEKGDRVVVTAQANGWYKGKKFPSGSPGTAQGIGTLIPQTHVLLLGNVADKELCEAFFIPVHQRNHTLGELVGEEGSEPHSPVCPPPESPHGEADQGEAEQDDPDDNVAPPPDSQQDDAGGNNEPQPEPEPAHSIASAPADATPSFGDLVVQPPDEGESMPAPHSPVAPVARKKRDNKDKGVAGERRGVMFNERAVLVRMDSVKSDVWQDVSDHVEKVLPGAAPKTSKPAAAEAEGEGEGEGEVQEGGLVDEEAAGVHSGAKMSDVEGNAGLLRTSHTAPAVVPPSPRLLGPTPGIDFRQKSFQLDNPDVLQENKKKLKQARVMRSVAVMAKRARNSIDLEEVVRKLQRKSQSTPNLRTGAAQRKQALEDRKRRREQLRVRRQEAQAQAEAQAEDGGTARAESDGGLEERG